MVEVSVPNIFEEAKEGAYYDEPTFKIELFLNEEELGKNPRKRIFWCLARAFNVDTFILKTMPAMVTLEKDRTMTINPANKYEKVDKEGNKIISMTNYFFLAVGYSGYIATYGFTFAFNVNDNYSFDDDIS